MTEEVRVEEELHDEVATEIVDETLDTDDSLEEAAALPKGGDAKSVKTVTEPESVASVDKAAGATKQAPAPGGVANQGEKRPKTKAGMINAMFTKMSGMSKAEMQGVYDSYIKNESVDMEEDEVIAETSVDTTAELDALVESEATLSDEFKAKTAVLFETAVKTKISEEVERLEEQYKDELAQEISETKSEMIEKVDGYLNYVVETWMEENKLAIQSGLRTEIAETFMTNLKDLFTESYIEVPESKVDLVDELSESVAELESKLNETTQKIIDTNEQLEDYKRESIIREASRDLADTQVEKLKSLVEDVDFDSEEKFAEKVATIKESYFSKKVIAEEEVHGENVDDTVEVSADMDRYIQAIRKTAPRV
jgi:hypothetical protein